MLELQVEVSVDQDCASWFTCLPPMTKQHVRTNVNKMVTLLINSLYDNQTCSEKSEATVTEGDQTNTLQKFCGMIIDQMTYSRQIENEDLTKLKADIEVECQKTLQTQYQERLVKLQAQIEVLQSQVDAQVKDAILKRIDTVENELRHRVEEKERALSDMQKGQLEEWRHVHANVVEMESRWEKFCGTKNVGSSSKGKTAELLYEDLLRDLFPKYELYRVAHVSHSGDFHLMYAATQFLRRYGIVIELKNYTQTVPSPQIQKFHNDVTAIHKFEHMQGVEVMHGILISIDSGIAGKDLMQVEIIKDKHVLIYLPKHLCDSVTLLCAVKVIAHLHKFLITSNRDSGNAMVRIDEEKKAQLLKYLNDMLRDQSLLRQSLQASLKLCDDKYITNIMRLISDCST